MRRSACTALLLLAGVALAGCAPQPRYDRRYDYEYEPAEPRVRDYDYDEDVRRARDMDDDEAWEIVRRDPCRYDEYRRFAARHKNPERRREAVWRLAHEGCSRERARDDDDDR